MMNNWVVVAINTLALSLPLRSTHVTHDVSAYTDLFDCGNFTSTLLKGSFLWQASLFSLLAGLIYDIRNFIDFSTVRKFY
jgi:hypothetical protein